MQSLIADNGVNHLFIVQFPFSLEKENRGGLKKFRIFHRSLAFPGAEEWKGVWRVCVVMKSII